MSSCSTLVDLLEHRATVCPNKPAFIFRGYHGSRSVLTFADLYRLGGRWAHVLRSKGLGRGSLVANTLVNSPERAVSETAIILTGAASVNAHCQLADGSDLLRTLRQSRAVAILIDPDVPNTPWNVLQKYVQMGENSNVISEELPSLQHVFFIKRGEKEDDEDFICQIEKQENWFKADDVKEDDICTVLTTSGSTGFSKLVVFTHGYIATVFKGSSNEMPEENKLFNLSEMGWIGGCVGFTVVAGLTRVLHDIKDGLVPENDDEFVWSTIVEEKCLTAAMLPTTANRIFKYVKECINRGDVKNANWILDTILCFGVPVTSSVLDAIGVLTKSLLIGYGGTDFGFVSRQVLNEKGDFVDGDTGIPLSTCELRIVSDDEKEIPVPVDTVGHIQVKQKQMFSQYLNDPEATAPAFTADGFFRTGDLGKLDTRGHLIVYGRGSDAINGHYVFYPGWLETRIKACPGVQEVAVVGVPDPFPLEEICACVILQSDDITLDDVKRFVENDIVVTTDDPMSARPRYYLKFETFPKTYTGKPARKKIKEFAFQRLMPVIQEKTKNG